MTSRVLINPLPKKSGVSLRATIQNPRPRKYASDADRQKAFRERQAVIQVRVAPKAVETFDEIAETLGYSRQEVVYALLMKGLMSLGNWETVGLPIDWQKKMPQFKLPRYEENPMKRKATPAQLAARERFAEMARSGAFKRKAKAAPKRKKNPMGVAGGRYEIVWAGSGDLKGSYDDLGQAKDFLDDIDRPPGLFYGIDTKTGKRFYSFAAETRMLKKNPAPRGFVKADDYTVDVFNKYGMKPYNAVYMQTKGGRGEPTYDLTILKHDSGKYLAAHGSVLVKQEFDRASDAAAYLEKWYAANREPAARRSNPADRERKPSVVLITNPQARTAKVKRSVNPNFQFAVQAQKRYPGNAVGYETVAGFPTKAQAQDYVNALLKAYPKGLTLRIMEGNA